MDFSIIIKKYNQIIIIDIYTIDIIISNYDYLKNEDDLFLDLFLFYQIDINNGN